MTPANALDAARDYKRKLVDELNRVSSFERAAAIAVERDRQGNERLAFVRKLGRERYAQGFLAMFGEPMERR